MTDPRFALSFTYQGAAPPGSKSIFAVENYDGAMVAGLERATNAQASAGSPQPALPDQLALLQRFNALPASLRAKLVALGTADLAVLNSDGTTATQVFSLNDVAADPKSATPIPIVKHGNRQALNFAGLQVGMKSDLNAQLLARMSGITGYAFGVIARKNASGSSTSQPCAFRLTTDSATRPQTAIIYCNNSGDWTVSTRPREDTTAVVETSGSGATKYGVFDVIVGHYKYSTGKLETRINGAAALVSSSKAVAVTIVNGSGMSIEIGRNAMSNTTASNLNGQVALWFIVRSEMTDAEVLALEAVLMPLRDELNAA